LSLEELVLVPYLQRSLLGPLLLINLCTRLGLSLLLRLCLCLCLCLSDLNLRSIGLALEVLLECCLSRLSLRHSRIL
jgi:hypothetical protein